jgi:SAM-dependent methyltransferase
LARGARDVDAVEIDPAILGLGRDLNPARPYSDRRVTTHVQDGRAYLRSADGEYDLVVYAVTDSLALVSNTANLRLESFLFTREAFDEVRDHLAPDGVFVLYNLYRERWLVEKLAAMLDATFGAPPLVRLFPSESGAAAVLAAGPAVQALDGGSPPGDRVDDITSTDQSAPATDDWPFLYLREPTVAPFYLGALLIVLLLAVGAVVGAARARSIPLRRFSPHFFVLGIAFLLLETRSLATFSLLFGTTWVVNALAFFGILASVLAAIGVTAWLKPRRSGWIYLALGLSLVVGYFVPPESLLIDPPWARYVAASLLAFAPIFFANLAFTFSFRDTASADMAFASNLLGAVVGGCLEYLALVTGYQALLIVVLALYGCAFLLATRFRTLADRELVDEAGVAERVPAAAASPSS